MPLRLRAVLVGLVVFLGLAALSWAATGTTDAQVQLYELPIWRAQTRGQFIPVT